MPAAPTVSVWPFNKRDRPRRGSRPRSTATTLGRPGSASSTVTSRSSARQAEASTPAISASPPPPGTKTGLTDGTATSRSSRPNTASGRTRGCAGRDMLLLAARAEERRPAVEASVADGPVAAAAALPCPAVHRETRAPFAAERVVKPGLPARGDGRAQCLPDGPIETPRLQRREPFDGPVGA